MKTNLPKFYAITDRKRYKPDFLQTVEEILKKGVKILQIREKDLPPDELFNLVKQVKKLTDAYNAKLIVNDRLDVAVLAGADGVHLPSKSIPIAEVKKNFPNLIVGKSCHSIEELKEAEKQGADYVFLSPVFFVEGKGKPIGIETLKQAGKETNIPIYALGGITKENLKSVLDTGVFGVASIRLFLDKNFDLTNLQ